MLVGALFHVRTDHSEQKTDVVYTSDKMAAANQRGVGLE